MREEREGGGQGEGRRGEEGGGGREERGGRREGRGEGRRGEEREEGGEGRKERVRRGVVMKGVREGETEGSQMTLPAISMDVELEPATLERMHWYTPPDPAPTNVMV